MNPRRLLTIAQWLPQYQRAWLKLDLVAGLTLAAYAIPVSLAYASLAGLPPQMGLYCYLAGGLGYVLFGGCRQLAIGPTSAISLLVGVSLANLADEGRSQAQLASLAAALTAMALLAAWLLRLSVFVNFISDSILTGFKAGAALVIASTQLPKFLRVAGGGDDFFERVGLLIRQLGQTHLLTLGIGLVALVLLLVGNRLWPRRPIALAVVLAGLAVVKVFALDEAGVRIVGEIPAGLPQFQWPGSVWISLSPSDARQLTRLACACFLLSYIESYSAGQTFALRRGYDLDPRRELLGLGAANALAGLWQGFPVAGGLSQSAVNDRGGACTPLSLVWASAAIGCVLAFLTESFRTLPDAVLAAVVLVAVAGLIDLSELRHLWRVSRMDFAAATVALAGVLWMGVLDGVVIAVLASVLMLLARSSHPHVAFLGRIPGSSRFSDLARHPENERIPGVVIFRVQASLLYYNVSHVLDVVRERVRQEEGTRRVVCDLSNVPYLDVAGARMLRRLHTEWSGQGIEFRVVEAHGPVRDLLRAEGLEQVLGSITRHLSLADALADPTGALGGQSL